MESLWQDLRYAGRVLVKNPGFTAVAVLVLALGIGANTAIFTLTNSLLLRPIVAEAPNELVALYSKNTRQPDVYRAFSYPNFEDIRELNVTFSSVMAHDLTTAGLMEGDVTRRVFAEVVSHDYFDTFGVMPFRGRFFTPAEATPGSGVPVVVVSYEYWRNNAEDPDLVGSTLSLNGVDLTIVGIGPRNFSGRTAIFSPGIYIPFGMHHVLMNDMFVDGQAALTDRDNHRLLIVGRLKPGLTTADAEEQLAALATRMEESFPSINADQTFIVGPLSRMSISTSPTDDGPVGLVALVLLAMTGIVLLIACINLANMLLARGAARRKEFAIRAAIGGGRGRIIRQLLTEGLVLSLIGGAASLLIAYWVNSMLARSMNQLMALNGFSMDLLLHSAPDARILAATATFCIVGTLLFGFGPAWRQSRPDVMEDLKDQTGDAHRHGGRWALGRRNLLVVSQIALSLVLLVAAGLFIRGAFAAADVEPGFRLDNGLLVEIDPSLIGYEEARSRELYSRLSERLASIPGIESASVAATVPFGSVSSGRRVRRAEDLPGSAAAGGEEIETFGATSNVIGADYFETLDLPIVSGRAFTVAEATSDGGARVAIIDELLADMLWPDQNPIGRQIGFGRQRGDTSIAIGGDSPPPGEELSASEEVPRSADMEVVGVVPTVMDDLFQSEPRPHVYVPFGQNFQAGMNIHLRTAPMDATASAALLQAVRTEIRAIDERLPIMSLKTLQGHVAESASQWMVQLGANIFTAFGFLALFLAVVGVYGVKAYTVAQRTHEIGIRKALGATTRETLWLILREGMAMTMAGLGIGLLLAAGVARLLSSLLYEVSALDPLAFIVAPIVLAAAALLATFVPARRAASVAPSVALRQD